MNSSPLCVTFDQSICTLEMCQPEQGNPINRALVDAMHLALDECAERASIVILKGSKDVFCNGADFHRMEQQSRQGELETHSPERMYQLWRRLACGPYISICHIQGKVNAGGVGFVAACDIVLADTNTSISLSEMLFDITPACVLPFLIRKTGLQPANYLTLSTLPMDVEWAYHTGLIDAYSEKSEDLLRKHLLRLRRLNKSAILRYKNYINQINPILETAQKRAIDLNHQLFSDTEILSKIFHFIESGDVFTQEQSKP